MKKRRLIGIIALIVGVVIAGGLLTINFLQTKQTTTVYATNTTENAGAQITQDMITAEKIQIADKKDNYVTDPKAIVGCYATVDLVSDDIITAGKISKTAISTDNQFLSIPSGQQAISFSVSGGADSLSNKLQVGDIIRIYSYNKRADKVNSPDTLKYVRVANITSSSYNDVKGNGNNGKDSGSSSDDSSKTYSTITVIVYTKQVNDIIRIQKSDGAYVTLISRGNDKVAEQLLKEQVKLLK